MIPTIIQNANTKQVLMLGYSNEESLAKTKATGHVWFYSRSKQRLWEKGESSGHYLNVVSIRQDCDQDAILIAVHPEGPTCHTGCVSCFGNDTVSDTLAELAAVIAQRAVAPDMNSYTQRLLNQGRDYICAKVAEESAEVLHAAKHQSAQRVREETGDLLYHVLVLLQQQGVSWTEVMQELRRRRS